jgi:hypothetical protein
MGAGHPMTLASAIGGVPALMIFADMPHPLRTHPYLRPGADYGRDRPRPWTASDVSLAEEGDNFRLP